MKRNEVRRVIRKLREGLAPCELELLPEQRDLAIEVAADLESGLYRSPGEALHTWRTILTATRPFLPKN